MDVQKNTTRERIFSILNDNDSPSFVIRQKQLSASPKPQRLPSISSIASLSPRLERPNFLRQVQYQRNSSVSSAGSPPLLRYDSSSSKASSSSMDSSPSPVTPAYNYNDAVMQYDGVIRSDLNAGYLPSPTTITPFMEQQMMIASGLGNQLPTFEPKAMPIPPMYSGMPMLQTDPQQIPTPALSNHASVSSNSSHNTQAKTSPVNGNPPTGKKNKYPCPYAQSHNCFATFTTSGHAARHGKKHTGEKGVHCPVCNKAFTRKDNMKQHERTHKNKHSSDDSRSKAAITKDAQKAKGHKKNESESSTSARRSSIIQSPLSEVPSLAANTADTPKNISDPTFYQDPSPTLLLAPDAMTVDGMVSSSLYPPLMHETMLPIQAEKLESTVPLPPTLVRGFSDLDTLAQAAESFDPYYPTQF